MRALLFLAALATLVQSPQKKASTTKSKQPPTSYQRGSDTAPVFVKLLDSTEREAEAARQTAQIAADKDAKWWDKAGVVASAVLTLGLLIAAVAQWRTSDRQREIGDKQREIADKQREIMAAQHGTMEHQRSIMDVQTQLMGNSVLAMDKQREILDDQVASSKRIERAYMFLSTTPTRNENATMHLVYGSPRPLQFVNLGKTPARVESVIASCRYWPKGAVETLIEQPDGQKIETFAVWLAGGREPLGVKYVQCTASAEQIEMAAQGDGIIALIGHISYHDIFGDSHDFGFAFEMPGNPPVMVEIPNPHLNYSR